MVKTKLGKEEVKLYADDGRKIPYFTQVVHLKRWQVVAWFAVGWITRAVFGL